MCDSKAFYSTAYFVLRIILICLFCSGSYAKKPPVAISAEGQKDEQEHVSDVNMSEPVDTCTPSEGSKHCDLSLPVSAQKVMLSASIANYV